MNTYKLRIWTGPTLVRELTTKLREAGVEVVCEGTEHVHVRSEGSDRHAAAHNVLATLMKAYNTDFCLKPQAV
jgi:hypothetical protein